MDHTFLIILLMSLQNSYHCRHLVSSRRKHSVTNFPSVRFSFNGHHFQIGLLSPVPNAVTEKCTKPTIENEQVEEPDTQTFTQFAMLNVSPKTAVRPENKVETPPKINHDQSMPIWNKVKNLYKELGDMLQAHEKELETLMKNQENPKAIGINASSGDTSVRVKINDVINREDVPKETTVQPRDDSNNGDPNSLNIHVHAEPPLKMRTIIGYPKSSKNIESLQKILRLYNQETDYPPIMQDSSYELNTKRSAQQGESREEAAFLRRGSELLLNMWRRFKEQKRKSKLQKLEPQNFQEDADDAKLINRHFSYLNERIMN